MYELTEHGISKETSYINKDTSYKYIVNAYYYVRDICPKHINL